MAVHVSVLSQPTFLTVTPKTLHLTNAWHPASGGIATFYKELLAAAEREGRLMRLVVPATESRVEAHGKHGLIYHVRAPRAPFNPAYRILYPHRFLAPGGELHRILKAEQPHVVEVCDKYTLPYLAGLLRIGAVPGLRFRPIVVGLTCERLDVNIAAYAAAGKAGAACSRLFMKWIYFPQFDHHIAVSDQTAAELRPAARGHKVERGVWVAPMGVDVDRFSPQRRSAAARCALARRAGVSCESALLLYAGRLVPEKNLELLLSVMERLAAIDGRDCRLLIAGSGCSERHLRTEAERRIPGRLRFLGHVTDRDDLASIYANADVFVHPNPEEPFGIAPLEAMAAGLPLVAPNRGGVTTYANETNAWLADPTGEAFAAAVSRVVVDDESRTRRSQLARATALDYRWERSAAEYLRLYSEIHERGRGRVAANHRPPTFSSTRGNWLGMETRRRFIAALLGVALAPKPSRAATAVCRRYRADAAIMLLGLRIYSLPSVGGGFAAIQEHASGEEQRIAIQFAAGSLPARAKGVNRFGFIQEVVTVRASVTERSEYLGLMTASPEKSLDEAKLSVENAAEVTPFSAIQGAAAGGKFRNSVRQALLPSRLQWHDWPELAGMVRALFGKKHTPDAEVTERPTSHARTFLYALSVAMADPRQEHAIPFLYNGRQYSLRASKQPDTAMGKRFMERQLVSTPDRVIRLNGVMTNLEDSAKSDFKLWFVSGEPITLPVRFEYRPRAFLHLAFEHDPSLTAPDSIPLFNQESI